MNTTRRGDGRPPRRQLPVSHLGEQTKLTQTMRFETSALRDMTMRYGVKSGAKAGHKRVDALLERLPLDV